MSCSSGEISNCFSSFVRDFTSEDNFVSLLSGVFSAKEDSADKSKAITTFIDCVKRVLLLNPENKQSKHYDRLYSAISSFIVEILKSPENNFSTFSLVVEAVLSYHSAQCKIVRTNVSFLCQLVFEKLLPIYDSINKDANFTQLINKLAAYFVRRLHDKCSTVRISSISILAILYNLLAASSNSNNNVINLNEIGSQSVFIADYNNTQFNINFNKTQSVGEKNTAGSAILNALINLLNTSSTTEVRVAVVKTLPVEQSTFSVIFDRINDVKESVVHAAFERILSDIPIKTLSISQRCSLLKKLFTTKFMKNFVSNTLFSFLNVGVVESHTNELSLDATITTRNQNIFGFIHLFEVEENFELMEKFLDFVFGEATFSPNNNKNLREEILKQFDMHFEMFLVEKQDENYEVSLNDELYVEKVFCLCYYIKNCHALNKIYKINFLTKFSDTFSVPHLVFMIRHLFDALIERVSEEDELHKIKMCITFCLNIIKQVENNHNNLFEYLDHDEIGKSVVYNACIQFLTEFGGRNYLLPIISVFIEIIADIVACLLICKPANYTSTMLIDSIILLISESVNPLEADMNSLDINHDDDNMNQHDNNENEADALKMAGIRFQLVSLKNDMEEAIKKQDFYLAADIKNKIEQLENERKSYENPRTVTESEENNVFTGTQSIFCGDNPNVLHACLVMNKEFMKQLKLRNLTSSQKTFFQQVILPAIQSSNVNLRNEAVINLGLYAIRDKNIARKYLFLVLQILQVDCEMIQHTAIKVCFDILLCYGAGLLEGSAEDEQQQEQQEQQQKQPPNGIDPTSSILNILLQILESDNYQSHEIVIEGLTKLLLLDRVRSSELVSKLAIAYFNPVNSEQLRMRKVLNLFFSLFAATAQKNQELLYTSIIPTVRTIYHAPEISPLSEIRINEVLEFFINLTSPDYVKNHTKKNTNGVLEESISNLRVILAQNEQDEFAVNYHNQLAIDCVSEILKEIEKDTDYVKIMLKLILVLSSTVTKDEEFFNNMQVALYLICEAKNFEEFDSSFLIILKKFAEKFSLTFNNVFEPENVVDESPTKLAEIEPVANKTKTTTKKRVVKKTTRKAKPTKNEEGEEVSGVVKRRRTKSKNKEEEEPVVKRRSLRNKK